MATEVGEMRRRAASEPRRSRGRTFEALAAAQHGAIARRQMRELGFTRHEIDGMVRARWLHAVFPGVYAVGRRSLSRKGRWMAAVLACGPGALLSRRCAGALHGIHRAAPATIEVTVPTDRGRAIDGIRTCRCRCLEPQDRTAVEGIPCTSVALTILDLAAVAGRRPAQRACDEAEVQRLFDLRAVEDVLRRSNGRRGTATLRAILAEHAIGTTLTRSELEERTLALCRRAQLPAPAVNADVAGASGRVYTVDFLWPAQRVVLETDGHAYHRTRRAVERDRRKEADLVTSGHRVLRGTWLAVEREPDRMAVMLRVALSL